MQKLVTRKRLIIVVVAVLVIASIAIIAYTLRGHSGESDPYKTPTYTNQTSQTPESSTDNSDTSTAPSQPVPATVDPATVSVVNIPEFGVAVSYVKELPGFAYAIQRAQNGTQYLEFTSERLVGDKCTDDKGVFATIIKNPQAGSDSATISSTAKVGDVIYGLSLAADTCSSNPSLLAQYQKSFKDAFSLLKASSTDAPN